MVRYKSFSLPPLLPPNHFLSFSKVSDILFLIKFPNNFIRFSVFICNFAAKFKHILIFNNMLQKLFGFDPAQNKLKTEVAAGITTFLTMAYILAVTLTSSVISPLRAWIHTQYSPPQYWLL